MKKALFLAIGFVLAAAVVRADNIKLNYVQQKSLLAALQALDGTTKLDKENTRVLVGFEFSASTRLAISKDIVAVTAGIAVVESSEAQYMKGRGITDTKNLPADQVAAMNDIANHATDVTLIRLPVDDLRLDANAIPGTVLAALTPLTENKP